ncbi:helix-turn-helix transcriptional regulator [Arthrobacter sp. Br18]|uniref:helix-turn-helix domain-containing protein n=1 Tax=Arthrobacter sp. Br18 TaxID=1312954 RepID=UPI0012DBE2F3|nr:helix-turn-helix transcriptional regulator [Arthrobacter sp. Br18]
MAEKKIALSGTGETVRRNVKRLRGGMQYKELAERLAYLGRPIPTLGLRRIEAGERRVDVDDLAALSIVFGVSPLTLLMPEDGSRFTSSFVTGVPDREIAHNAQWLWGTGQEPLVVHITQPEKLQGEVALFQNRSRPLIEPREQGDLGDRQLDTNGRGLLRAFGFGDVDDKQGLVYDDGDD